MEHIFQSLAQFWEYTGFANCSWQNIVMIGIGIVFITLAIVKEWEPMLLVPIGFGMIVGNIPMFPGLNIGIYEDGSVLNILYQGVRQGWYPPLIFLGIGAMTDFSALISQPRLILIGAAAQMGIFGRTCWPCCSVSRPMRRAPSASSAGPTVRPPSSSPPSWPRT